MSPPPGNGETPPVGQGGGGGHPQISGCSPPDPPVSVFFLPFCAAGPVIMSLEEKMEADARSIYVGNVSWGGDRRTDTPLGAQAPPPRPRPNSILCPPPPHTHPPRWITEPRQRSWRPTSTAAAPSTASPSSATNTAATPRGEWGDARGTGRAGTVTRPRHAPSRFPPRPRFAYIEFSDKESVRTSMALDESLFRGRQIKVKPRGGRRWGGGVRRGHAPSLSPSHFSPFFASLR